MIWETGKGRQKITSNVGDSDQTAAYDRREIDTWSLPLVPGTQLLQPLESEGESHLCDDEMIGTEDESGP